MPLLTDFKKALGVTDGANTSFSTPTPYVPGTLEIFPNGPHVDKSLDNGATEVDPGAGTFTMKVAPRAGTDLLVGYQEA